MNFPVEKMRFTTVHGANRSEEGWLVLDVRNMELEGVRQIVISMAQVRELKAMGERQPDLLREVRSLLGGAEEDQGEGEESVPGAGALAPGQYPQSQH